MSFSRIFAGLVAVFAFQGTAHAASTIFTAHISDTGAVLHQTPNWINGVERRIQTDYLTEYTLALDTRTTRGDPAFCSVSAIDKSQYERLIYGQGKIVSKPLAGKVTVITQLVDVTGPAGDNSLEFMLMCMR